LFNFCAGVFPQKTAEQSVKARNALKTVNCCSTTVCNLILSFTVSKPVFCGSGNPMPLWIGPRQSPHSRSKKPPAWEQADINKRSRKPVNVKYCRRRDGAIAASLHGSSKESLSLQGGKWPCRGETMDAFLGREFIGFSACLTPARRRERIGCKSE